MTRHALVLGPPMAAGAFLIGVSIWACFLNLTDTMSAQPWVLRVASVAGPASLGLGLIKVAADVAKARAAPDPAVARIEARLAALQDEVAGMRGLLEVLASRPGGDRPGEAMLPPSEGRTARHRGIHG